MKRTMLGGLVAVIALCMQAGCGSSGPDVDTHPVSGTVTYNGSPIGGATVTFVPDSGENAASGITDASGKYSLNTLGIAGAATGSYKVKIVKAQKNNVVAPPVVMGQDEPEDTAYVPEAEDATPAGGGQLLPEKYSNIKTSDLTATVTEGENTSDFALTD